MESAANTARLPEPAREAAAGGSSATPGRAEAPRLPAIEGRLVKRLVALHLRDYIALTKPRIISLLLLTTVTAMFVAGPSGPGLSVILWTMLGGYLAAGGAGAINH